MLNASLFTQRYDAILYSRALGNRSPGTHNLCLIEDADHNFTRPGVRSPSLPPPQKRYLTFSPEPGDGHRDGLEVVRSGPQWEVQNRSLGNRGAAQALKVPVMCGGFDDVPVSHYVHCELAKRFVPSGPVDLAIAHPPDQIALHRWKEGREMERERTGAKCTRSEML